MMGRALKFTEDMEVDHPFIGLLVSHKSNKVQKQIRKFSSSSPKDLRGVNIIFAATVKVPRSKN